MEKYKYKPRPKDVKVGDRMTVKSEASGRRVHCEVEAVNESSFLFRREVVLQGGMKDVRKAWFPRRAVYFRVDSGDGSRMGFVDAKLPLSDLKIKLFA